MWKKALNKFIKEYKKDKDVEAILLVGSYAVGNNNKYSDIDVYIILNNEVNYRKRGNKLVDGYLIEYFCNKVEQIYQYIDEGIIKHKGVMINMINNGIVLYDKNNIIPKMKEYIKNIELNKEKNNMLYYACWCAFDEYIAAEYNNHLQYYICLKYLVDCYMVNNGCFILPELKIEKFFKNEEYRKKYNIELPDDIKFINLVKKCFDKEDKDNLKELYDYVIGQGKFDINNFEQKEILK